MIFRITIATLLFSWISLLSNAQPFTSKRGEFTVNAIKGCAAPLTITVSAPQCDAAGTIGCDVAYILKPDGKPDYKTFKEGLLNFSFPYSTPGTYYIHLQVGANPLDSIRVDVVPNTLPAFDVFLCTGNQVTVKLNDINFDNYLINFNDASASVTVPPGSTQTHVYTAGNHIVSVKGLNSNAADNCINQNKPVTVGAFTAPVIDQVMVPSAQDIQLDFNAVQSYYLYKLEVATNSGTTFQQLAQPVSATSLTLNNLRPDLNYYCFQLAVLNGCNNSVQTRSNKLCSIKLDATAANNRNLLAWSTFTPIVSSYDLKRNTLSITAPSAGSLSAIDSLIICKEKYRYLLTAFSGASRSISNVDSVISFSTNPPTPVTDITAVVGQSGVDLEWEPVSGFTPKAFEVFREINGESFQVGTTTEFKINDPRYTTETPTCYYILYEDVCDNDSPPSIESCPIRLIPSLQNDNTVILSWSDYTGWQNGVAFYTVEKFDAAGQSLGAPVNVGLATTFTDSDEDLENQVYQYVVKANSPDGLPQAVSNRIIVIKNANIYHPSAFTPDRQGPTENEVFRVFGKYIESFELQIYTRWGEPMFITTDIEKGWDGTFKGSPMPEGTYTFVATITDLAGRTFKRSGNVLLLRKAK